MSIKVVPAKTILTCDRCNRSDVMSEGIFSNGGVHADKLQRWARGYDGSAGGISMDLDLCSDCANDFDKFLNEKEAP